MKNISDAADLMATARDALLREILPALPKDHRYAGLMIANVMAIAAREHDSGPGAARREAERLRVLLAAGAPVQAPQEEGDIASEDLCGLRRALGTAIRIGRFDDGPRAAALAAHLKQTAVDWVAISNPKALRADRPARDT